MKLLKRKYKMPDKCKNCSMPEKYRPKRPGACGICITNKEKDKTIIKYVSYYPEESDYDDYEYENC